MEEVADELKTHEHQNEAADKMNGNACQEADGSENSESTPVSDDICKMKSKLPDLQSPQENKEETSLSNESSTQLEASSSQDSSTKEASPISADPSAVESASDGISKVDENAAHVSNEMSIDDIEKDKCLGSEESMEVESLKESDPILCEPQEESPDGKTHTSNPIHVSSPVTVAEQDETSANTDLANSESPAENTENNAEIADPGSPAEIIESSSLKDAEVQDSGGDDAANSKSIPEDSEDKSMDHNDIDNHSDVSARTDGNSSEPTETTRFLNIDQDSVADEDDAELDARASLENVEDPFSTEHEESSEVGKTAEEVEESSEAPEVDEPEESLKSSGESSEVRKTTNDIEESSELEKAAEGVDESSEVEKTTDDVEESSEVEKASDDVEESCEGGKTSERAEESSELEKTTEGAEESSEVSETVEEPEESSEPRESTEELEESTEAEKSTEVVEEPSEVPETIENPEEPLEAREPKKPEEASEVGKTPKEEESPDVSKTIEEAEESTEGREMTCEPEETFEVTKGGEEVKESSELTETTKHAEDSNETQTEGDPETAKLTGAVSESKDVTEDEDVNDTTEAQKESSEAAKTQDESMDVAKSPEASTDAAKSSKESTDESDGAVGGAAKDVGSAEKPAAEPELMEIDDSSETDTVVSTESTTSRKTRKYETKATKHEKSSSKVADPEAEEVIIDDDDEEKVEEKPGKMTRRSKATSKGKTKSSNVESGDTETICIVPDLPEIESVTSLATSTKAEKKEKPSPVFQSGRTQRRAAKTAGIKLKKMMAESMSDTVEEAPGKNAVQPVEKSVNSANFVRKCAECKSRLVMSESCLFWETMEFCDEGCLGSYLKKLGKFCANCKGDVQAASLGKYCVRFGTDINQFCCSTCLEEFKKGLKVCSYCQKDISSGPEGFLAPVGDKGQFKDFCSQECMVLYEAISNNIPEPTEMQVCTVCNNERLVEVKVRLNKKETKLCSEVCFAAFKFANSIECDKCNMCRKYYHDGHNYVIYYEDELHTFCSKTCMNVYILGKRRIILCNTCKVKKYNFDMIKRVLSNGTTVMACSLNCLALYQSQKTSPSSRTSPCDNCGLSKAVQYHLNMSDSSVRNFCSLICVMNFQTQSKVKRSGVYPLGGPKRASSHKKSAASDASVPVISTVTSLAQTNGPKANSHSPAPSKTAAGKTGVIQQIVMRPPLPKPVHNKIIQCRPSHNTKGVSCKPFMTTKSTQTEKEDAKPVLIPIPVPIFVPLPCAMYKLPVPFAMPIPLPIPVPIFVPTTRNSAKGIMKQIAKIQKKIPKDPYEAELLMMAEMVAGEKKTDETSSSEEDDDNDNIGDASIADVSLHNESEDEARAPSSAGNQSPAVSTRSSISCKAPLLDDLTDIEDSLKPATIVPTERPPSEHSRDIEPPSPPIPKKARKRTSNAGLGAEALGVKRIRRSQDNQETSPTAPSPPLEIIRADANMNLKYTYGVNAWRQWVLMKNVDLEKTGAKNNRKPILFKTDLLKLTPDELSYALCLFLKEVKKPNGTEYAPDTLFYFCLGIQHYLYENGRVDNLFTDPFYESFTDRLDEVGIKFASMYDGTRQIVTRIEEEHLWESKQLGAHSPHVLLNTLMFFNTKHFNLATVDEHMQLSFAHIMKHWKRNSGGAAVPASSKNQPPGNRNVLLRFYPLQSTIDGNSRKKKMYEQKENEDNPLRCPVKLYEFYLSKCPESVKTRNDVFYLLPERSCVPDSPVWYSTMALDKKPLVKMLNRIKMVKEVNIALLTL